VQASTVTRDATTTGIIHHWPDHIGHPIDLDAVLDPDALYDGLTLAEREDLVRRRTWRGAVRLGDGVPVEDAA
jgi:hypothetical protein